LLLVGFPLISPLFASTSEANLPACCRRNGVHHCMGMGLDTGSGHALAILGVKCPKCPKSAVVVPVHVVFTMQGQSNFAAIVAHPSGKAQTEARYRIAFSRSRQKRGPPTLLS